MDTPFAIVFIFLGSAVIGWVAFILLAAVTKAVKDLFGRK